MKIAISQMNVTTGDLGSVSSRMVAQADAARAKGADLIVFPSTVLTGASAEGLLDSDAFRDDLAHTLMDLAQRMQLPALVPFAYTNSVASFHEVALMVNGQAMPLRSATYAGMLARERDFDDDDLAHAAEMPVTFELGDARVGVAFDYTQLSAIPQSPDHVDVVVYLPSDPFVAADERTSAAESVHDGCYLQDASRSGSWLVVVNPVGGFDDLVYVGASFVMAPWGELAYVAPTCEESFSVAELDLASEGPLAAVVAPPHTDARLVLWHALSLALGDFVTKSGHADVCLLLDGTLASSVCATLAVDALGPCHVHGLLAPLAGSEALADARTLASNLRLGTHEVDGEVLSDVASTLAGVPAGSAGADLRRDVAFARLADLARSTGGLVMADVDKTSVALGPLHLPTAASFAPIADVYRSDVADMARIRQTVSPVFPPSVLTRIEVPEGLLPEGELPAEQRLARIEAICYLHVEQNLCLAELGGDASRLELAPAVLERIRTSELARRTLPVFPAVSECAFDVRRWPVGLAWSDDDHPLPKDGDAASPHGSSIEAMLQALLGSDEPAIADEADLQDQERDAMGFLRDIAEGGGLDASSDDIFGTGMFSDN
ncbi:MAG: hypothetical protein PHR15_00135 [Atopobiaceae bacterium]|nr:hypothetical protein [Atopobiaceae bacterium]MCH4214282.1 hypothetical protein [Atopobiaceae bacterium]MCH4229421.1 hypothetical protein [Atopobiaceae bacterium]MDD2587426.1 hypothetical protein [Atopobiaceae bacterium]MDD3177354.1 hypothetical protein [Atopobiaceae bacterium]